MEMATGESPARVAISIALLPDAREVVEKIRDDTGIPSTEAMVRILEWFASLDRKLRLAILNNDQSTRDELVQLTMRELATEAAFAALADTASLDEIVAILRAIQARFARMRGAAAAGAMPGAGAVKGGAPGALPPPAGDTLRGRRGQRNQ